MKDLWYVFAGALLFIVAFSFGIVMVVVMTKVAPAVGEALAGLVGSLVGGCDAL